MSEVFRFTSLRSVQRIPDSIIQPKIIQAYGPSGKESTFHQQLRIKRQQNNIEAIITLANEFIKSSNFVSDLKNLQTPVEFIASLDEWLLSKDNRALPADIMAKVRSIAGKDLHAILNSANTTYWNDRNRVTDSLTAISISPANISARTKVILIRAICIFGLLERLVNNPGGISNSDDVYKILVKCIVILPSDVFPLLNGKSGQSISNITTSTNYVGLARTPAMADLMVVRQDLKRYELGEIAHIENVLKGEAKERMHKRAITTENIVTVEVEQEKEMEQDLQTTERFELQKAATQTIHEDTSFETGLTVTGSYGPTVSATANLGYTANQSKDESNQMSSTYARDITQRSLVRIQERVREERTTRTLIQVEETNKHSINNSTGTGNTVGIYRWINKVYNAQILNYGRRLLFEFVVPEPAAFFLYAKVAKSESDIASQDLQPPEPPIDPTTHQPLSPADIKIDNYLDWVKKYKVIDISPPPKELITVGLAWEKPADPDLGITEDTPARKFYRATKDIVIPDGYNALKVKGTIYASDWIYNCFITIGSTEIHKPDKPAAMPLLIDSPLKGETGQMPVALAIEHAWGYSISLVIICKRTDEAFEKWKISTYNAIINAYYERKREYEDQLSSLGIQQGINIQGRNPLENRDIEKRELKKSSIALLTGQKYESFGAIDKNTATTPPEKYPEINFQKAQEQRDFIQFFEQAFEWPQITYTFYPYFWGSKENWLETSKLNDPDPTFNAFLTAGAARVVVPVRPGFEQAMLYYLSTGHIWSGGQVPMVGDDLYVSIVQELQESTNTVSSGIPVGSSWEIRIPTTLVMLQTDASLPTF